MTLKQTKRAQKHKNFNIDFLFKITAHDLREINDEYLFIGECYYPTTSTTTHYNSNGTRSYTPGIHTHTQTTSSFEGFQYTRAFICKFDKNGKLMWDHAFRMEIEDKPKEVKKFLSVSEKGQNSIKLAYMSEDSITTKEIDYDGNIVKEKESTEIETMQEEDKIVKRLYTSNNNNKYTVSIEYWYDNYFIAYGRQKLKNKTNKDVDKKRDVFFINKIKYE